MRKLLCLAILLSAYGCRQHSHVGETAAEHEPHPESFSHWTTKTELFAEYLPLVAGETSRFTVHLTRLDTFKPVESGRVEIRLQDAGGAGQSFTAASPARPGIFEVDVKPAQAGQYRISVQLSGGPLEDIHDLGTIDCTATKAEALHEHGPGTEEKVAFLKEQQWSLDFATAIIEDRQLRTSLRVPAEVLPRSGGETEVTAPFDGRLVVENVPAIGARVQQGQVLASLLPPTSTPSDLASLKLNRDETQLALELARKDRERAERLVKSGAAPAKRLDEALTVEATQQARLRASDERLAQYDNSSFAGGVAQGAKLFSLRAPISGVLTLVDVASGANVKGGQALFRIVDADTVYVSAIVPEAELPRVRELSGAKLEIPGGGELRTLTNLVSIGRVVDPESRTFPVVYQVDNRDRGIAIHQTIHVHLLSRLAEVAPVVPEAAVVDDSGRPVVFIQESGETFVRRPVKLGIRESGYVQVLEGAFPGERVVTRGAYLIRLSALSTQAPAHGHVH
jgi:membrane fusion protein, heavy metal efflux system